MVVQGRIQLIRLNGMETAQVSRQGAGRLPARVRIDAVHFAAVARRKYQRLFQDSLRSQLLRRALGLLFRERHPLPHFDWCSPEIQADKNKLHALSFALLKIAMMLREIEVHHRKAQHYPHEIEYAEF